MTIRHDSIQAIRRRVRRETFQAPDGSDQYLVAIPNFAGGENARYFQAKEKADAFAASDTAIITAWSAEE